MNASEDVIKKSWNGNGQIDAVERIGQDSDNTFAVKYTAEDDGKHYSCFAVVNDDGSVSWF